MGILAGVCGAFLSVGLVVQAISLPWGLWFGEVFVFLGLTWVILRLGNVDPVAAAGLRTFRWSDAIGGFAVGACNYVGWAVPLLWLAEQVFPERWSELFDSSQIFRDQSPLELGVVIGGVTLAAPFCEEFFFRGVVQPRLASWVAPARAVVVTALAFSMLHLDPVGLLARFELGVVFGLLALRTGSIWPAVFAHAANNALSSAAYFLSEVQLPAWVLGAMFLAGNAGLVVLSTLVRRLRWFAAIPQAASAVRPNQGLLRTASPWFLGALISGGLLVAVDFRGVVLNLFDQAHPVHRPTPEAPEPERLEWADLKALRSRARAGEVSLEEYFRARKSASLDPPARDAP